MRQTLLLIFMTSTASAQVGSRESVPVNMPERPFLLVDAPRRFVPTESANVRVQLRDGGRGKLTLFRVTRPHELLGQAGARQGVAVAGLPLGAEAERLVAGGGQLPRSGQTLTLVAERDLNMPHPEGPRRVWDETKVYDSNEDVEDNVATYWVRSERWSVRRVSLGRLPAGLYLAQVRSAAWVSSTIVSIGELVVVARRGDRSDVVRVSDSDGAPLQGVAVAALGGGQARAQATTDAHGIATFAARPTETIRFQATRGDDIAWADVSHVRLAACDPRVYLATGRPIYRNGETQHIRGHVRGCAGPQYAPLPNRAVMLRSGEHEARVTTDANGNFIAELPANGELVATLDGREHHRDVQIDSRSLPRRDLVITPDRPWASAGDVIRVRVSDNSGGWPHEANVVLETPAGRAYGTVGPGRPAVLSVRIPSTKSAAQRFPMSASLSEAGRVTLARTEIFVGRVPTLMQISAPERGERDGEVLVEVRASDIGGDPVQGRVQLAVFGSDGNRRRGLRHREQAELVGGRLSATLPLVGGGPWMLRATHEGAETQLVVWSRQRPPSLSRRGTLAVLPTRTRTAVGENVVVALRLPRRGRAWLTLEQGGVLWHREVGTADREVNVPVPAGANGLATLRLTHVHRGQIATASSGLDVATSEEMELSVQADRSIYRRGARARVEVKAQGLDGLPRDSVISLWLADAGYWGLAQERYPLPGEYHRLPGRPASGDDSQRPISYGAEEGRRLDTELIIDGQPSGEATFRHAWRYGGEVVSLRSQGTLERVVADIARAAGFARSEVDCPEHQQEHTLVARNLPWDLVMLLLGDKVDASPGVDEQHRLVLSCGGFGGVGLGGIGAGGSGSGFGYGAGRSGLSREERLEGTLHFVGLEQLGADGRVVLDIPLPDHPGRWRIEVLAISQDGGGNRAHAIVRTRQPLEAWVDLPQVMQEGDSTSGVIRMRGRPNLAGLQLQIRSTPGLHVSGAPAQVDLDSTGRASIPISLEARAAGASELTIALSGPASDALRTRVVVHRDSVERDLLATATLGSRASEIDFDLPPTDQPTTLSLRTGADVEDQARRLLAQLRRPRWQIAVMRVDRLASLHALARALPEGSSLSADVHHAIRAESRAIERMHTSTGELGWGDDADASLTLEAISVMGGRGHFLHSSHALRRRLEAGELHGADLARAIRWVADGPVDQALMLALEESRGDIEALTEVLGAARHHRRRVVARFAANRLIKAVESRLESAEMPRPCEGLAWFLCFSRRSEQGVMARAVLALGSARDRRAAGLRSKLGEWLAQQPGRQQTFMWGTDEADILELFASAAGPVGRATAEVDGRQVQISEAGEIRIPAGAGRLRLRFGAQAGRLSQLQIAGRVSTPAPTQTEGNVQLSRRLTRERSELTFTLPRDAEDVYIELPIPAGLTPNGRLPASASLIDGKLLLYWPRLNAGAHRVRLPLVPTATGTFHTGPATLSAERGALTAITAPATIQL